MRSTASGVFFSVPHNAFPLSEPGESMNRQVSTVPNRSRNRLVVLLGILAASCIIVMCIGSVAALLLFPKIAALGSPISTGLPQATPAAAGSPSPTILPPAAQAAIDRYASSGMYKSFRIVQVNGRGQLPKTEQTYDQVMCLTVSFEDALFGQIQTRGMLVVREGGLWYMVFPDRDTWLGYACPGAYVSPD